MTSGVARRSPGKDVDPGNATDSGRRRRPGDGLATASSSCPGCVWLVALFLVPLAIIGVFSLGVGRPERPAITLDNPSLGNYERALNPDFLTAVRPVDLLLARRRRSCRSLIGYPVAYWISRYGGRRKILLLVLVMLPFWTSYLIRTYAWMIILRDDGVVNGLLMQTGLIDEPAGVMRHGLQRDPRA